jgi:mono/diheme cytochrome c family protein
MRLRTEVLLVLLVCLVVTAGCVRKTAPAAPASAVRPPEVPAPVAPAVLPYEVRLGKVTFTHYCQTCHGESGAGDGFNAFNLDPHPRDLSDPEFQKKKSNAELADAIQRGGAGVGLSALMPPWGHTLSARQIDELVLYLRTLPALRKPVS